MQKHERKPLISVTREDCDWQYFRAGGNGGQNVNKVESGVRVIHRDSGAVGRAVDTRDQHRNRRLAFKRMAETPQFRDWLRLEISKRTVDMRAIEDAVDKAMESENLKIEFF